MIENLMTTLVGWLWSTPLVVLCLLVGIIYSIIFKFPQIFRIKEMFHYLVKGEKSDSGISSFQGFAMALGGRIGVGAIAGVATAVCFGGPGAIFWMWVYAIFGAAAGMGEAVLAQTWKDRVAGEYRGGPAYYIDKGTGFKPLAILFAVFGVIAFGFTGPAIQAFNIAESTHRAFGVSPILTGVIIAAAFGLVVFGGMKRIGSFAGVVVPVMAAAYFIVMIIVLVVNASQIPAMFALIFKCAFNAQAAYGAVFGSAIMWGIKRAVYSTEAGMGSGAHAAASAEVSHPVKQGMAQACSVYVDTLFACTATGLMILVTGAYNVMAPDGSFITENLPGVDAGIQFAQAAVDTVLPGTSGSIFLALAVLFFAFTTILSFGFYVMPNIAYLLKNNKYLKQITIGVGGLQMISIILGSVRESAFAWNLADIGVGLLAWVNLLGMLLLLKPAKKVMDDYISQKKMGLDPVFDPDKCGIKNADLWKDIVKESYADVNTDREAE